MSSEQIHAQLELVAEGFSFPTSLTFDDAATPYIAEAGLPFGGVVAEARTGKLWRWQM